jgi:EpsI family protein
MNIDRRRAIQLAAAMGATAALASWLRPSPRSTRVGSAVQLERLLPIRLGDWTLDGDATSFVRAIERGRQTALYDQVLERSFIHPSGHRVMLSLAYLGDQSSDIQLHRPEVCYRAGGFRIGELRRAQLPVDGRSIPVTRLLAEMPGRPEPITYWTVVGGEPSSSTVPPWTIRLRRALQRRDTQGVLVRVSSIDPDPERAFQVHGQFTRDLVSAIAPADRDFVLGLRHPV